AADQVCTPELLDVMRDGRGDDIHGVCNGAYSQTIITIEPALAAAHPYLLEDDQTVLVGKGLECLNKKLLVKLLVCRLYPWHFVSSMVRIRCIFRLSSIYRLTSPFLCLCQGTHVIVRTCP